MVVIFIVALLVFGPRKLPELGRSLGRGISEFRRASTELRSSLEREMHSIEQETRFDEFTQNPAEQETKIEESSETPAEQETKIEESTQNPAEVSAHSVTAVDDRSSRSEATSGERQD